MKRMRVVLLLALWTAGAPPSLAAPLAAVATKGTRGMVVSAEEQASQAGVEVLAAGGNAADAAVATAFALAVTWPEAGNIGGGGFWVSRDAKGKVATIDFREAAPMAATFDLYTALEKQGKPDASLEGPVSAGIPGSVAGLYMAHKGQGHLPWARCLAPAIRLAQKGMKITENIHNSLERHKDQLTQKEAQAIFLPGGKVPQVGSVLKQPELAETLSLIASRGPEGFYRGPVAEKIAVWQKQTGGLITLDDLLRYKAIERPATTFSFAGYDIITAGPPASGTTLAEIGGILETFGADKLRTDGPDAVHLVAEAEKRAYRDRNEFLGDPDFIKIPLDRLLSPKHITELARSIDPARSVPLSGAAPPKEKLQTTHYSVVDGSGGAVSVTTTLNNGFGSGLVVPGAGFVMNNEMDDFAAHPGKPNLYGLIQGANNAVAGGKRMLSSMCPSIAVQGGKVRLVWGTPGGSTIITTNFQIMWHVLLQKRDLVAAQNALRFHQQDSPDRIILEDGWAPETVQRLQAMGHQIGKFHTLGKVNAIQILPDGSRLGVTDPRGGGAAAAQ